MGIKQVRSPARALATKRLDLATLIAEVVQSYEEVCARQGVEVDIDVPDNLWVDLDPVLMRDAFHKVVDNALDAMPRGGCITITSLVGRFGLEVEFADTGAGLADEILERVFEPFSTTKHHRAGLGLSIVRDIASVHQASVTASNCPDGGAAFTFLFPFRQAIRQAA